MVPDAMYIVRIEFVSWNQQDVMKGQNINIYIYIYIYIIHSVDF